LSTKVESSRRKGKSKFLTSWSGWVVDCERLDCPLKKSLSYETMLNLSWIVLYQVCWRCEIWLKAKYLHSTIKIFFFLSIYLLQKNGSAPFGWLWMALWYLVVEWPKIASSTLYFPFSKSSRFLTLKSTHFIRHSIAPWLHSGLSLWYCFEMWRNRMILLSF